MYSLSKRIRLYGHLIDFTPNDDGNMKSNMCSIVLCTSVYYLNIIKYLAIPEVILFCKISNFHKKFIQNKNNTHFSSKFFLSFVKTNCEYSII